MTLDDDLWFPYTSQAEFNQACADWDARQALNHPNYRHGMIVGAFGAWVAAKRGIDLRGRCFTRADGTPVAIDPAR